ncbi:LOB domain-containing protein 16-like [Silene latifolia]|uniref:LOB domain-containing protein 16-like n=1 Tax=Silene latifolia TaxID=37657 RepID=UPI003D78A203
MAAGVGSPCGACKFLRRKCGPDCVFAPYFCSEQGPARFAAIHKVFGASNVSKLLLKLPVHERCEAVVTIAYEAQARVRDPVYGCVAHIFALQQQVAYLQAQLMQAKAQLSNNQVHNHTMDQNQWSAHHNFVGVPPTTTTATVTAQNYVNNPISSPQSSLDSIDYQQCGHGHGHGHDHMDMVEMAMHDFGGVIQAKNEGIIGKKRSHDDIGELEELAIRMMGN